MIILFWLRRRIGDPAEPTDTTDSALAAAFWLFAAAAGAIWAGLIAFGVSSYHVTRDQVLSVPQIPLLDAAAMAAAAVAALATGWLFHRVHARVLLVVPVLMVAIPVLAFSDVAWVAAVGVLPWGVATGVQDSTIKAGVADLVPASRRATAYACSHPTFDGERSAGPSAATWCARYVAVAVGPSPA